MLSIAIAKVRVHLDAASLAELTPDVISAMSREEAGAALDRLSDQYRGVQPTAALMKFTPTDAVEANAKLNALKQNADWMKLYSQGHPDAVAEVKKLSDPIAGGTADLALAGVVPEQHFDSGTGASLRDQISAVRDFRMNGLNSATRASAFTTYGYVPANLAAYLTALEAADNAYMASVNSAASTLGAAGYTIPNSGTPNPGNVSPGDMGFSGSLSPNASLGNGFATMGATP